MGISHPFPAQVAVYRAAGLGDASARRMTLALGLVKFATTLAMILKIAGLARRPLLLGSLAATVVLAAALAAIFGTDPDGAGPVVVVACLLYTAAFQVGFGTLNFLLLGEVFPPRLKGRRGALHGGPGLRPPEVHVDQGAVLRAEVGQELLVREDATLSAIVQCLASICIHTCVYTYYTLIFACTHTYTPTNVLTSTTKMWTLMAIVCLCMLMVCSLLFHILMFSVGLICMFVCV